MLQSSRTQTTPCGSICNGNWDKKVKAIMFNVYLVLFSVFVFRRRSASLKQCQFSCKTALFKHLSNMTTILVTLVCPSCEYLLNMIEAFHVLLQPMPLYLGLDEMSPGKYYMVWSLFIWCYLVPCMLPFTTSFSMISLLLTILSNIS